MTSANLAGRYWVENVQGKGNLSALIKNYPPKITVTHPLKRDHFRRKYHLPNIHFQLQLVIFREGTSSKNEAASGDTSAML